MKRLRELRKKKRYTQVRVQIETGIDQSEFSRMELGKRIPTLEQTILLAKLFNTSVDYLAELTDVPEPYPRSEKFR